MTSLLVIIYISFISLGLPDSLLGSAWPIIQADLSAPFSVAGYISMVISAGTVLSSLFSNRLISKFGTGKITFISVAMTAAALFGYTYAPNIPLLFVMSIPLGLGAGSVDAALNNFVALHYQAKHMSWLHCFWGIGATAGPAIMSINLMKQGGWRTGYLIIAILQAALVVLLLVTLPLWKKHVKSERAPAQSTEKVLSNRQALHTPYVKLALLSFIFFSATEVTTGLWSSSFLVSAKGASATDAARWVSFFYAGITVGRLLAGFVSMRFQSHTLIRAGQLTCIVGTLLMMLPLPVGFSVLGIIFLGLGTAPIFPGMLHETPSRFGVAASQAIMGLQMAFAYMGGTFFPPLFGSLASVTTIKLFPYFLLVCILVMLIASELLQKKIDKKNAPFA